MDLLGYQPQTRTKSPVWNWGRHDHTRVAWTIFPNQDPGKVHKATPTPTPCVSKWVRSISGKIHTASIDSSWKKKTTSNKIVNWVGYHSGSSHLSFVLTVRLTVCSNSNTDAIVLWRRLQQPSTLQTLKVLLQVVGYITSHSFLGNTCLKSYHLRVAGA